ncbi:hypothetical protein BH24CHL7_BH24CHL7_11740 [soil metagenome]
MEPATYDAPMPKRWFRLAALFLPAAVVVVLLAPFADVDPVDGFTFSNSPFTDEAWWLANARNFAHFGYWSTDDWNLHLVSPVYSVLQAAALAIGDVDMLSARLMVVGTVSVTCLVLAFGLRGPFGARPAILAATAYGSSVLVLYYGRLAYVEPVVALALVTGSLFVARVDDRRPWLWGLLGGGFLALAIGAKPTAIPLVAGLLGGLLLVEGRQSSWARRWTLGAGAVIIAMAVAWALLVLLPQREAVSVVGRILAEVTLPADAGELLYRVLAYPVSNDLALIYSIPLLLGGGAGVVLAWRQRESLPAPTRRLLVVAASWVLVGIVVLMVIPYRPNRYFLPLLPALAVLTAAALSLWPARAAGLPSRRSMSRVGLLVAGTALTLPGLLLHAGWMWNGTRQLLPLQQQVAEALPPGAVVEGAYGPLWAFRAPVTAIVSRPDSMVNGGDLYATRGVRWIVTQPQAVPAWAAQHPAKWSARRTVLCHRWGREELCLFNVP